jgi:dynein heavy chain, axonemal
MVESSLIQEWLKFGLPMDNVSKENQIIIGCSDRWPLLVDPQGQGRKFIKKWEGREDEKRLYICKPNKNFDKQLENVRKFKKIQKEK